VERPQAGCFGERHVGVAVVADVQDAAGIDSDALDYDVPQATGLAAAVLIRHEDALDLQPVGGLSVEEGPQVVLREVRVRYQHDPRAVPFDRQPGQFGDRMVRHGQAALDGHFDGDEGGAGGGDGAGEQRRRHRAVDLEQVDLGQPVARDGAIPRPLLGSFA
jgi:hypothetical protein